MMRTMRAKVLVDLVGLSLVGSACSNDRSAASFAPRKLSAKGDIGWSTT